jgi:Flp pilus assembly pilin Flp
MPELVELVKRIGADENGQPLLEYTILLGIIVVGVLGIIVYAGTWVSGKWNSLSQILSSHS